MGEQAGVVVGKRLIQSATDIFVGWTSDRGHDYYVRQFRDMKVIASGEMIAPRLVEFATACGGVRARPHRGCHRHRRLHPQGPQV